ncbi:hypothetical protein RHMOL_Rhmol05G0278100 [Rhododendron molle]|uniref:Uncharacterized protein n=1 Tax=Rhododendron molle TaxID=49168 RepID=A0ACC0NTZ6_RHOML|nr:hypothetical protein RHMOL_Rhmol05G0278100 [Rhododendron molle]
MAAPIVLCLQFLCFALAIIGTRAQGGSWEVVVEDAGIAPMHAAVTRWNTVVLFDWTDAGASNISLPNVEGRGLATDSSAHSALLDLQNNAVFPLTIQTDTWCSSGQFLPNGTLLLSGGRNDDLPQLEGGPRNYMSAGSSAMLPLEGDYSTATIVICGGAQYDAYINQSVNLPAQESCGRIVATDPNPDWEMETMPHVLNTAEMVTLPTGAILIINGTGPSLNPVIYQPAKSECSRFTILNPTTIPRMYHSTANLLPDGRILLAGSNTHRATVGDFPTDQRIEAFSPDYLVANNSNLRPMVVKAPNTMQYGKLYNVYVTMPSPLRKTVEVNFASTPYSMHSFSQGQSADW